MASGWALKAHRTLDGRKQFQLHHAGGAAEPVDWSVAGALAARGLIDSNKKFPAATYWLTEAGRAAVAALSRDSAAN